MLGKRGLCSNLELTDVHVIATLAVLQVVAGEIRFCRKKIMWVWFYLWKY